MFISQDKKQAKQNTLNVQKEAKKQIIFISGESAEEKCFQSRF